MSASATRVAGSSASSESSESSSGFVDGGHPFRVVGRARVLGVLRGASRRLEGARWDEAGGRRREGALDAAVARAPGRDGASPGGDDDATADASLRDGANARPDVDLARAVDAERCDW